MSLGCAAISRACGEQRFGKAGVTRAWILVEQPGPWGSEPFEGRGASGVLHRLRDRLRGLPVKLLAIRRHGRSAERASRTAFLCHSGSPEPWVERVDPRDERRLLDLDPVSLCQGERPRIGEPHDQPVYLVCTHGRKDACCAVRGRPVAKALTAVRPGQVWESSHVGGDRFAANLVCLPHGLVYGHLAPETVGTVAEAYEGGELVLDHLRGRSCHPPPAQAAEHLVRLRTGLYGIDAVTVLETDDLGDGRFEVRLGLATGRVRALVRRGSSPGPRRLTCGATESREPPHWELVSTVGIV